MPSTSPENRKSMTVTPPAAADHFSVERCTVVDGHGRRTKMTGPPDDDGHVADTWPTGEFSPAKILAMWGDGKYRVEWYGADDERMKGLAQTFEVATPARGAKKGAPRTMQSKRRRLAVDDEPEPLERVAQAGGQVGILDMLAMLRAEREDAQQRAQEQAERDRQFWSQQQQSQMQMMQMWMGKGGAGGASDPGAMDLLKRELKHNQDVALFQLRKDLLGLKDELEPETEPGGDDEPPKDMGEAGERIGMSIMAELEEAAPELVQQLLPSLINVLRGKGFTLSDELQARIEAAKNGHAHPS